MPGEPRGNMKAVSVLEIPEFGSFFQRHSNCEA